MSKVFNMVSGGGGKNISSIIITGLSSTDTVTCTKDGKSYTATWDSTAQHWEIVGLPLGTFTITATNGTSTKTETVLIDIVGIYEIEMSFVMLWLYRDGNAYTSVTGGWAIDTDYYNGGTFEKTDEYMRLYNNGTKNGLAIITGNSFDLTNYTKICFEYAINALSGCDVRLGLGNSYEWGITSGYQASSSVSRKVDKFDITKRDKNYYATVKAWYAEVLVYKVWFE